MKSSLGLSVLIAFSLLNCDLFAGSGEHPPATQPTHSGAAVISTPDDSMPSVSSHFVIPGPQRSFLRMAGISQQITPQEVLPLLSENVFTEGVEGSSRPTEFLILLRRYVVQARELAELATDLACRIGLALDNARLVGQQR